MSKGMTFSIPMTAAALAFFSVAMLLSIGEEAAAQPRRSAIGRGSDATATFAVNRVIGDGKSGRVFQRWEQRIDERPVESVTVALRKERGGDDTFVNLRFGSGETFENGKREYLRGGGAKSVTWRVDGREPDGQPLVLNIYNGEATVERVEVRYADAARPQATIGQPFSTGSQPRPRADNNDRDEDNGNDSYQPRDSDDDAGAIERCRRTRKLRRPRIETGRLRQSGGLFSGKYRLEGSIYGSCIEEAGYFEDGRLKEQFRFPLDDRHQRREFEVQVRSGRNGEIRVFNTRGDEESIAIDELIKDSSEQSGEGAFPF